MARTSVVTQQITRAGLNPTLTQPTVDGDVVDIGATFLYVDNASVASVNVTVQTPVTVDGLNVEELIVAVPAGQFRLIGPFPPRTFAQPTTSPDAGRAYVDYSAQTSVTRAVLKL